MQNGLLFCDGPIRSFSDTCKKPSNVEIIAKNPSHIPVKNDKVTFPLKSRLRMKCSNSQVRRVSTNRVLRYDVRFKRFAFHLAGCLTLLLFVSFFCFFQWINKLVHQQCPIRIFYWITISFRRTGSQALARISFGDTTTS